LGLSQCLGSSGKFSQPRNVRLLKISQDFAEKAK